MNSNNLCDELKQLYKNTILSINSRDYTADEINGGSLVVKNTERWKELITNLYFIVAENDQHQVIVFSSISENVYLHFMFVHKDYQNKELHRLYIL